MKSTPSWSYPSSGEIIFALAVRSGVVRSETPASDEHQDLYQQLKRYRQEEGADPADVERRCRAGIKSLLQKQFPTVADALLDALGGWIHHYYDLIDSVPAACLTRQQLVDEILWPHLFSMWCGFALRIVHEQYGLVDIEQLLTSPHPMGSAILQLVERCGLSRPALAKMLASPEEEETDSGKRIGRWINGKALPQAKHVSKLLDAFESAGREAVSAWLMAGRLLEQLESRWRRPILNAFEATPAVVNLGRIISQRNQEEGKKAPSEALELFGRLMLHSQLARGVHRQWGDRAQISGWLDRLDALTAGIRGAEAPLQWMHGRFQVFSGNLIGAVSHYNAAIDAALYSDTQLHLMRYDLVLIAHRLEDKNLYKHHFARLPAEIRESLSDPATANGRLASEYEVAFPLQARFLESDSDGP